MTLPPALHGKHGIRLMGWWVFGTWLSAPDPNPMPIFSLRRWIWYGSQHARIR